MNATPNHRKELGAFLNAEGLTGSMAEIGCAFGAFARMTLAVWKGKFYHMIDPWTAQDPAVYKEKQEEASKYDKWFEECTRFSKEEYRARPLRLLSSDAVRYFDDGELDCVYIDGNHDLEHSYEDIKLWYPKVKPGGLLGGHDCYNDKTRGHYCEVADAVDKWFKETGNSVVLTECTSWWHRKPVFTPYVPTSEDEERMAQ